MKVEKFLIITGLILFSCSEKVAQKQFADLNYQPEPFLPTYSGKNVPTVYLDEAHENFHTIDGRYKAFESLLVSDGYRVTSFTRKFTQESLRDIEILVIANALGDSTNLTLPATPAFTKEEVLTLNRWVADGGSLFLIADHMPAPAPVARLASSFGFSFINGYVYNYKTYADVDVFSKNDGLVEHPLTKDIDSIATFCGQGFLIPDSAQSIINLGQDYIIYLPLEAGKIHGSKTPKFYANGLSQGAVMEYNEGKIAVFGEAGMFTAQISIHGSDTLKMGMNNDSAVLNHQLLLNIIHWLDNIYEDE